LFNLDIYLGLGNRMCRPDTHVFTYAWFGYAPPSVWRACPPSAWRAYGFKHTHTVYRLFI